MTELESDEPTKAELLERIEALEAQQQTTESKQDRVLGLFEQFKKGRIGRRAFLTSVSAVAGITYAVGTASAQVSPSWSNATGNSGTEATPLSTIYARDAYHETVSTERIGSRYYAGGFDGSDPDARLDNTLAAASDGDIILLEGGGATYNDNRTISDQLLIRGCNAASQISETQINGDWTVDASCGLVNLHLSGDTSLTAQHSTVRACNGAFGTITISADGCGVVIGRDHDVTFDSGSSGGLADALWQSTVTDNGTNTVGTIG